LNKDIESNWAIHNSLKGWTLFDLSLKDMQLLIKSMSLNEQKLSHVCRSGDLNWVRLNEDLFPLFFQYKSIKLGQYPNLDNLSSEFGDTEYFVVRPQKIIQPRLHKRYEIQVNCLIFSTTRQFSTKTIDLSEGGLYLFDTIPDWVAGYFIVGVQTTEDYFQLLCSIVEDQKDRRRVQIVSEDQDLQFLGYKSWLHTLLS
jgi:hypothetical protein